MAASFYVNESRLAQIEEETEGNESMISEKENKTPRTVACPSKKSRITIVGDPNLEQSLLEMSTMSFANTSMRRPSESGPFGNVSHRLDFSTSQISESGALGDISQRSEMPSDRTLKENSFLLFDNNSPRGTVRALEETSCSVRTADDTFSALGEIKGIADQLQQQLALEEKLKEATSSQQTALAQIEALKAENATLLQKMKDTEEKALNAELKAKTAEEKVQSAQEELTSAVEKLERCLVEKASLDGLPVKVADEITPLLGELETNITEAIHNASLRQNQSILEKNEQIAQLEFKLAESETELATLEEEMTIRNERISAQEEEIASLEEKVTTLKEEMAKECEELDKKEEKLTAEAYNAKKEMLEVKIQFGIITPEEAVHQLGDAGALQDFMKLICTN